MWICDCCSELNNDRSGKCCYCSLKKTVRGRATPLKHRKKKTPWYAYAASVAAFAIVIACGALLIKNILLDADDSEEYISDAVNEDSDSTAKADGIQNSASSAEHSDEHDDSERDILQDIMPTDTQEVNSDMDDETDYYDYDSESYTGGWERDQYPDFSEFVVYSQDGQTVSFIVVSYNSTGTKIASSDIRDVELHGGSGTFRFTDSWGNTGHGTITFDGDTMDLNIVVEYINNSLWALDQASGTYTKFTDVIDQDILADYYGDG